MACANCVGANPKISAIAALLLAVYAALPHFGVSVPTLPPGWNDGAAFAIVFLLGLFSKSPQGPVATKVAVTAQRLTNG